MNAIRWGLSSLVVLFSFLALSSVAYGQNPLVIYVAPQTGSAPPTGDGSFNSPFQTLQQAADAANLISPGIDVTIFILETGEIGPGNFTRDVALEGSPGVEVTATGSTGNVLTFSGSGGSSVHRLKVRCKGATNGISSQTPAFIAQEVKVDGCTAGFSQLTAGNVVIKNSTMTNNGTGVRLDAGAATTRAYIEGNDCIGNAECLTVNNGSGVCNNCKFIGNGRGVAVVGSGDWKCDHCELVGNGVGGSSCGPQCSINYSMCDFADNATPLQGLGNKSFGNNTYTGTGASLVFPGGTTPLK